MLQAAIESEVIDYIQFYKDRRDEDGQRLVVRNGHLPEREIVRGVGPIAEFHDAFAIVTTCSAGPERAARQKPLLRFTYRPMPISAQTSPAALIPLTRWWYCRAAWVHSPALPTAWHRNSSSAPPTSASTRSVRPTPTRRPHRGRDAPRFLVGWDRQEQRRLGPVVSCA